MNRIVRLEGVTMSRTDKDMPYWVTNAWEPEHSPDCRARRSACDLPNRPHRQHSNWKLYAGWHCHWSPSGGWRRRSAPRWFINHVWSAPDRMRARIDAQTMRAEHRASGEVDQEPRTAQHRHGALWDWN
jgi:hypothetical protein